MRCDHKIQEVSACCGVKRAHAVAFLEFQNSSFFDRKSRQPDISSLSGCRLLQPENSSFCSKLEFWFRVG